MAKLRTPIAIVGLIVAAGALVYWTYSPADRSLRKTQQIELEQESGSTDAIRPLSLPKDLNIAKARLGKALFLDQRLSRNNQISCHSCHSFTKGGTDGRQFSVGIGGAIGNVNAPTVFNSGLNFRQFWNGRADDLHAQAGGPVENPIEMGAQWADVIVKLSADSLMVDAFYSVYQEPITQERIIDALAEFERSLVTMDSPFDRYLRGEDGALSASQERGYRKFDQYGCIACHQGKNIGGNMFQTMGVARNYFKDRGGQYESDEGRFAVTKVQSDMHVFKVPGLRNVELTSPYFHDGSEPSLQGAVRKMALYQLGRQLPNEDVEDIANFLKSLTGKTPAILSEEYGNKN